MNLTLFVSFHDEYIILGRLEANAYSIKITLKLKPEDTAQQQGQPSPGTRSPRGGSVRDRLLRVNPLDCTGRSRGNDSDEDNDDDENHTRGDTTPGMYTRLPALDPNFPIQLILVVYFCLCFENSFFVQYINIE